MKSDHFAETDLSCDAFLGGKAQLWQPRAGYRAGIDPVLLAATVPARTGETVLDLGCGAAPALCCLGVRVPGLRLLGLEIQPAYAALAQRNLAHNGLSGVIMTGDIAHPPEVLKTYAADHVIANPPYFDPAERYSADDPGRELGLAGPVPLAAWVALGARRLKPRGTLTVVLRVERMPAMIAAMSKLLGSLEIWPLAPRTMRAPRLFFARARKGGRAAFRLHPSLILHDGARHLEDGEDYSQLIRAALRNGQELNFPR
ncbi:methyltransferase [Salipiger aestuarii]|uniref:tRNA1(Val) A37 N6-methylase TrmN6 n=1 Tax=Salipiger aestuarii TaxID=568098 RepID=A0A327Y5U8_9RHOB|nr:methyltransferase [Salipiger aestuarii]KAB2541864.1 methyltransferase [Salipiger aestuarii]RAK15386.1 tRNA1(Val) A37 N6-methylase TrmN6 [Salipiger aestuarii]